MSIPGSVNLILAQMGQAERLAQELQAHPEVQRQAAQQAAPEILRKENAQVQAPEKGDGSAKVRDREARGRQGQAGHDKRQAKGSGQEDEPDPGRDDAPPWAGNIVNIKV